MAFSESRIFRSFVADMITNTAPFNLTSDAPKVALYGNTGTPSVDDSSANTAYGVGQWIAANELSSTTDWPVGGVALASTTVNTAANGIVYYDAADTSSGATATITDAYGTLIYDDTLTTPVADQGIAYTYFGGATGVTVGVFTVVWHPYGLFRLNL